MARPGDMPGPERFAHGTHSRYTCGCRCTECRAANTACYHARLRRAKELASAIVVPTVPITKTYRTAAGWTRVRTYRRACPGVGGKACPLSAHLRKDSMGVCCRCRDRLVWNGLVSPRKARGHLRKLSAAGVGRRAVAAASDVGTTTICEILNGRKRFIRADVERRILAVSKDALSNGALVPATKTWELLDELIARGFTRTEIARRLGLKSRPIQLARGMVLARTALAVEKLHRAAGNPPVREPGPVFCECIRPLEADGRCGRCDRACRPEGMTRALLGEERKQHALARAFGWEGGWGLEQRTSRRAKVRETKELVRLARRPSSECGALNQEDRA